jgi:Holliday junction resolvasome RuvABC ATP-dependent DNA helicase subunit
MLEKAKTERINLLFYGQQGTGKTTTAKMFAVELNKPFVYLNGTMSKEKIMEVLLNSKRNSLILIDEIHSWRESIAELIYPAIQDNELIINGKIKKIDYMFIGTTTEPEKLPKPLLDRFKQVELEELEGEQLRKLMLIKGCQEKAIDLILNYSNNFRIIQNIIDLIKLY